MLCWRSESGAAPCGKKGTMATKKSPTTSAPSSTTKKAPARQAAKVVASTAASSTAAAKATKPQAATKPAPKPQAAGTTTTATTTALAERLRRCREAVEVKVPEARGIAVRLKTRQLEIPMLVHLPERTDGLVVFDVYPFRFVGIDAVKTDWLAMIRAAGSGYVQLRLDQDIGDKDVLVYSFHMPLSVLDDDVAATTLGTLSAFAEDHYDDVMNATGLVEKQRATSTTAATSATKKPTPRR